MAVAAVFQRTVESCGIRRIREDGREICAAAEPCFSGDDHARVHVNGGNQRRLRMRDQRNTARPEFAVAFIRAGNFSGKFGRECAPDFRDIHADFFKHAPMHEGNFTAAIEHAARAIGLVGFFAVPWFAHEPSGGLIARF